ncbi:uncharacterized protein JCM6883_004755 [Sporobolomyces salmoneus]|uniref:uncharacterized protein n=1 Tax=Sporobolomyces salmoneus TaxID=183962 RepID=UPI00317671D3
MSSTTNDNAAAHNQGNAVGQDLGTRSKGLFGAISGAGEAIRGTINGGLDGLGDGIAGRDQGSVQSKEAEKSGQQNGEIANNGVKDFKEGVADLLNGGKK